MSIVSTIETQLVANQGLTEMTSSEEMTFALYIDIVSIFHNILRELFQFDFSIDEHLKLLVSYVLNFAI